MKFITYNMGWKLLSLLAGFLVWWNLGNDPDLATMLNAPVQFRDYPKDLEISSAIIDSVDVEARGTSGQLRELRSARLSAIIDLSSVTTPGERTFTLTSKEVKLPQGVQLVRTIPAQLRLIFEKRTTRELKVDVPTSGEPSAGLRVARIDIFPPALTITGPESRVRAARNAMADPIDLSHMTEDSQKDLAVYVAESEVRFVNKPQVTVKIHFERKH
jgi:YbbR domain-containing protein